MYVCIYFVARINQRVFRNSSIQMFSMPLMSNDDARSNVRPSAGARCEAASYYILLILQHEK